MVISAQFSKTVARSDDCHSQRVDENERERYAQWNLRFSSLSMGKVNAYLKMKEIEKKTRSRSSRSCACCKCLTSKNLSHWSPKQHALRKNGFAVPLTNNWIHSSSARITFKYETQTSYVSWFDFKLKPAWFLSAISPKQWMIFYFCYHLTWPLQF